MNFLSGTFVAGIFAFCTALFWGTYGPILSKGHHLMHTDGRLRPFICVGIAYLLVAVIGPVVVMYTTGIDKGEGLLSGWTFWGFVWSTIAGAVGALGAFALIMALGAGGPSSPVYVMPIVFGCAPVVSAFTSMYMNNTFDKISPFFAAGLILVAVGAVTILLTAPKPPKKPSPDSHSAKPAAKAVVETKPAKLDEKNPYASSNLPATKEDPEQIRAATLAALPKTPDASESADVKPLSSQPADDSPADDSPGDHQTA